VHEDVLPDSKEHDQDTVEMRVRIRTLAISEVGYLLV